MGAELPAGQALGSSPPETGEGKQEAESPAGFGILLTGILVLAAAAYLSLALGWPKFSRAEVFFAECVREMFQADNFVTPLYHGTPFFDKPILAYWFIAGSYKIAGISHFAARLPSVIAALGTVALSAFAGRYLFGARQGILAACVLASSAMFVSFANLCMSDMLLVFFDTASLSLLYLSLVDEKRHSAFLYLAALSMGLAFLTKGPVGIVLPALMFAIYLSLTRQWQKVHFIKDVLPCTLILLGAGVPWFMAAFRQNGAGALSYFFIHENLQRFIGSTYDTHRPVWFMLQSLVTGMLPWSVFLPFALFDSFKVLTAKPQSNSEPPDSKTSAGTGSDLPDSNNKLARTGLSLADRQVYLWLWIAVVIGFFSLSRGKIDYYALPVYPAAAILVGNFLAGAGSARARAAIISAWLLAVLMLLLACACLFVLPSFFLQEGIPGWQVLPAILFACALLMIHSCLKAHTLRTFLLVFAAINLLAISLSWQIYPWITSKQAVLKYIPYMRTMAENGRVGVYASLQNWIDEITYQTGREPIKIESSKMAEQLLKGKAPCLLLIQEPEYYEMSPEARQKSRIIASSPFIPRSLNPMYFISKGQKLADKSKLYLVANYQAVSDSDTKR